MNLPDFYAASEPLAAPAAPAAPGVHPIAFDRFQQEVRDLYAPGLRRPTTRWGIEFALKLLSEAGVTSTDQLTLATVAKVVTNAPAEHSPNTLRSRLRAISSVCSLACASGYLTVSPFKIRPISAWVRSAPPAGKRHLGKDEICRISAVLESDVLTREGWALWRARRLLCMFKCVIYTGLRKGELLWLRVEDLDIEHRIVEVRDRKEHRTKTARSAQPVVWADPLTPFLTDWLAHRMDAPEGFTRPENPYLWPNPTTTTPWTEGPIGYKPLCRLKAVAKRAGVQECSWQALRRSYATHLERAGLGQAEIARLCRHTEQVSKAFYRQNDIRNMRDAVQGFDYT